MKKAASLFRRSLAALTSAPSKTLRRLLGKKENQPAPPESRTEAVRDHHTAKVKAGHVPAGQRRKPPEPGSPRSGERGQSANGRARKERPHPAGSPNRETSADASKMEPTPTPPVPFQWIDQSEQLTALVQHLSEGLETGRFTRTYLDTEADSLHHYTAKLCLLQLAAGDEFYLIDPLQCGDLSGLFAVLDRSELWLHGADYDLTLLKRQWGWTPQRVHDTQIAARLTGHRAFGLAALVQHYCEITLCKSSQKADWSQRPLPSKMQAYAVDDVRYLGTLVDRLLEELGRAGRLSWFEQSCESLRVDVLGRTEKDRSDAWRISGSGNLKPKGLALLKEVWWWRDATASEKDVPPFKVLNNQQLLGLAFDYQEKGQATHPPRWRPKWRETFNAAIHRVRQSDPDTWPQRLRRHQRRSTEEERTRIEQLCALREARASKLGLEPSLLGSRDTLMDLVLGANGELGNILMPWQREVLGLDEGK